MKLNEFLHSSEFDTKAFIQTLVSKREKYPANSLSPREVVFESKDLSRQEAEDFCKALNKDVTDFILKYQKDYFKKKN
jgi:hypothetical protein